MYFLLLLGYEIFPRSLNGNSLFVRTFFPGKLNEAYPHYFPTFSYNLHGAQGSFMVNLIPLCGPEIPRFASNSSDRCLSKLFISKLFIRAGNYDVIPRQVRMREFDLGVL